jgi:hypothetical protein
VTAAEKARELASEAVRDFRAGRPIGLKGYAAGYWLVAADRDRSLIPHRAEYLAAVKELFAEQCPASSVSELGPLGVML